MAKLIRSLIAPDKASSLKLGLCDIDIVGGEDYELLKSKATKASPSEGCLPGWDSRLTDCLSIEIIGWLSRLI